MGTIIEWLPVIEMEDQTYEQHFLYERNSQSLPSLDKDLVETTQSNSCYSRWIYGFFYFLPHELLYHKHYERPVKTEGLSLFATPLAAVKRNYRLLSGPSCPSNIIGTPLSGFKRFSSYKWSNFGQELCYYIIYIFSFFKICLWQ